MKEVGRRVVLACVAALAIAVVSSKEPCGPPDAIEGAELMYAVDKNKTSFLQGDTVRYKCQFGRDIRYPYDADISDSRKCRNGEWSSPKFECQYRSCSYLDHPEHGRRLDMNNEPGQNTWFECNDGYIMHGSSSMLCRVGGTWRPAMPPTCKPVFCPEPLDIRHGSLWQESLDGIYNDFGSVVTYSCDDFYHLGGLSSRRCMGDGRWEGDEPFCYKAVCKKFSPFLHGKVTYTSDSIESGTMAYFECDDHAVMVPNVEYSMCLANGEWLETPECRKQQRLVPDAKHSFFYLKRYVFHSSWKEIGPNGKWLNSGEKAKLECKGNYELYHNGYLNKISYVFENKNGDWSPLLPECIEGRCNLPEVKYGKLEYQNTSEPNGKIESGVTLKTICNFGHEVETETHQQITCRNGQIDSPKCVPKSCKLPKRSENVRYYLGGEKIWHSKVRHDSEISVSCSSSEYELAIENEQDGTINYPSSFSSTCKLGEMEPDIFPTCEEKRCSLKEFEEQGYLSPMYQNQSLKDAAMVPSNVNVLLRCSRGYQFNEIDNQTILVLCEKGSFKNRPYCKPIPCSKPKLENAFVERDMAEYPHNTKVNMKCNHGYTFSGGQPEITCEFGQWTEILANCVEKNCSIWDIHDFDRLLVNNRQPSTYEKQNQAASNTNVSITCGPNYESDQDESMQINCVRGEWLGSLDCKPKSCLLPEISEASVIEEEAVFNHSSNVTVKCMEGYKFPGGQIMVKMQCNFGDWAGKPDGCAIKKCYTADIKGIGKIQLKEEAQAIEQGQSVVLLCKPGYTSKEERTSIFCDNGSWNGTLACEESSCLVPQIGNATVRHVATKKFVRQNETVESGHQVKVHCVAGFETNDNQHSQTVACTRGGWDKPFIQCIEKPCKANTIHEFNNVNILTKDNRTVGKENEFDPGSVLLLSCKYEESQSSSIQKNITCIEGRWNDQLYCGPSNCTIPEVKHAKLYTSSDRRPLQAGDQMGDGEMIIACEKNYVLDNSQHLETLKTVECEDGKWSEPIRCVKPEKNKCDDLAPPANGIITKKQRKDNKKVFKITVSCDADHEIVTGTTVLPSFQTTCDNGDLRKPLPLCRRIEGRTYIDCKLPERNSYRLGVPKNAKGSLDGYIRHNATISVQCLTGDEVSIQTKCVDGAWDPKIKSCGSQQEDTENDDCRLPGDMKYKFDGVEIGRGDQIADGQSVKVECTVDRTPYYTFDDDLNEFFIFCHRGTLHGLNESYCLDDCERAVANGNVVMDTGNWRVECNDGYSLSVSDEHNKFVCRDGQLFVNGKDQTVQCLPKVCSLPSILGMDVKTSPGGILLTGSTPVKHLDQILLKCRNGHEPSDRIFYCSAGKWITNDTSWSFNASEPWPICRKVVCPECRKNGGDCRNSTKCECPKGKIGDNCEKAGCHAPDVENVLITNPRDAYSVGESVDLSCGPGAQLEGDQQLRCLSSGTWGGSALCRGTEVNYLITVKTGTKRGAGTDADVYIQLFGENNQHTEDVELTHDIAKALNKFENGDEDEFIVKLRDIGDIFKIRIRVDDRNIVTGYWYLEYISIKVTERQKSYMFPVNAWLSDNYETYEFYTKVLAETEYRIEMETWKFKKGTPLFIQLIGANGHLTEEADLTNNLTLIAKRGDMHTYEYIFRRQPDLVKISKVLIRSGGTKHWHIIYVKINVPERQEVYTFQIKKWITEPDKLYEPLT